MSFSIMYGMCCVAILLACTTLCVGDTNPLVLKNAKYQSKTNADPPVNLDAFTLNSPGRLPAEFYCKTSDCWGCFGWDNERNDGVTYEQVCCPNCGTDNHTYLVPYKAELDKGCCKIYCRYMT